MYEIQFVPLREHRPLSDNQLILYRVTITIFYDIRIKIRAICTDKMQNFILKQVVHTFTTGLEMVKIRRAQMPGAISSDDLIFFTTGL